jgi:hypothetical protein
MVEKKQGILALLLTYIHRTKMQPTFLFVFFPTLLTALHSSVYEYMYMCKKFSFVLYPTNSDFDSKN